VLTEERDDDMKVWIDQERDNDMKVWIDQDL
jgi:hypothetical protein